MDCKLKVAISPRIMGRARYFKMSEEALEYKEFFLGATAWEQPGWEGRFYPADMPSEWRLAFFNTQFDCVFLERDVWQAVPREQWLQWLDDTHEKFLFLLETAPGTQLPAGDDDRVRAIGRDDPQLIWFDRETDLKGLAGELMGDKVTNERYLISRDGDLGTLERVRTLLELMGK